MRSGVIVQGSAQYGVLYITVRSTSLLGCATRRAPAGHPSAVNVRAWHGCGPHHRGCELIGQNGKAAAQHASSSKNRTRPTGRHFQVCVTRLSGLGVPWHRRTGRSYFAFQGPHLTRKFNRQEQCDHGACVRIVSQGLLKHSVGIVKDYRSASQAVLGCQ